MEENIKMSRGWIYCLSNKSIPGMLKIGQTKNSPQTRADQLFTSGVPTPFKIEFAKNVENYDKKEKTIHSLLEKFTVRVNQKREFFEISVEDAKMIFDLMDGEDYVEPVDENCTNIKN